MLLSSMKGSKIILTQKLFVAHSLRCSLPAQGRRFSFKISSALKGSDDSPKKSIRALTPTLLLSKAAASPKDNASGPEKAQGSHTTKKPAALKGSDDSPKKRIRALTPTLLLSKAAASPKDNASGPEKAQGSHTTKKPRVLTPTLGSKFAAAPKTVIKEVDEDRNAEEPVQYRVVGEDESLREPEVNEEVAEVAKNEGGVLGTSRVNKAWARELVAEVAKNEGGVLGTSRVNKAWARELDGAKKEKEKEKDVMSTKSSSSFLWDASTVDETLASTAFWWDASTVDETMASTLFSEGTTNIKSVGSMWLDFVEGRVIPSPFCRVACKNFMDDE